MGAPPRRVRLRPWLVAQVDSGRYPGLRWLDPQRRLFCIPWRHATRHAPRQPDGDTVFKAWAQETGKFTAGLDEPDPAKWKATLRCALNKSRDFRLRYDGTRDAPLRPYKVYELCAPADAQAEDDYGDTGDDDVSQLQHLTSLSIDEAPPELPPLPVWPEEDEDGDGDSGPVAGPPPGPAEAQEPPGALGPPLADTFVPNLLFSPQALPLTDLELTFAYRGRQVGALTVSNPQGCRLFHGGPAPAPAHAALLGPPALEQVPLPGAEAAGGERQRRYTRRLLGALARGLLLELRGQDLFGVRLCQCKVFWSGPCAAARPGPNALPRGARTRLFSLERFLSGLIRFQKGQTATPPPFEILLCFGEEWPDHKPKEKKLITVQVVPVAARLLLELFSGELSWSADSVPLHISPPDLDDRLVEHFKELQQLWQSQQRPEGPGAAAAGGKWDPPPPPAPWGFSQG
ncbi:interferon regulatory factor 5 [Eudromia elegans]